MSDAQAVYESFLQTWAGNCGAPAGVFTGQLNILIRAVRAEERDACCAAICWRCRAGHGVGLAHGDWEHGTDHVGDGVYAPPEPCAADAIRKRGGRP